MDSFREIEQLPPRIFVIGDIHGCGEELATLLSFLKTEKKLTQEDLLVCIGDYIDRGTESSDVIRQLIEHQKSFPNSVYLKGNHEEMLLDYLGFEGRLGEAYLANGGTETLRSYNISAYVSPEEALAQFPRDHISFLLNLDRYLIVDKYVIVHAGLNPLRDLKSQIDSDIFWIRDEFIGNIHHFEKTVIFGHTPYRDVFFNLPYKIGIDTGAVYGNRLSCLELLGGEIYSVDNGDTIVGVSKFP